MAKVRGVLLEGAWWGSAPLLLAPPLLFGLPPVVAGPPLGPASEQAMLTGWPLVSWAVGGLWSLRPLV